MNYGDYLEFLMIFKCGLDCFFLECLIILGNFIKDAEGIKIEFRIVDLMP